MKINDDDLSKYISTFLGYGNIDSDYWHIGKEEAGEAKDINARLKAWINLGSSVVLDNFEFHSEFAIQKEKPNCYANLFNEEKTVQKTWAGQIKIQFAIEKNELPPLKRLKEFQAKEFGRSDSKNAILELFPLPAPNHSKHNYQSYSNLSYLKDKQAYKSKVISKRIKDLNSLIFERKPKFVIFYSTSKEFINYWKKVVGGLAFKTKYKVGVRNKGNRYLLLDKKDGITFVITQHPTYTGTSDNELLETGRVIKRFSSKCIYP